MELALRYQIIQKKFEELSDFPEEELVKSRNLFHLETVPVVPKSFEVWTILAGLPLPDHLTQRFQAITQRITERLPAQIRFYKVLPQNYHWELFIIKRPNEELDQETLQKVPYTLKEVLRNQPPFTLSYQGFIITPDGTIIVKGYGNFDELRTRLRQAIPWASLQQSTLGHVSLGRILDPVGRECFTKLKNLIQASEHESYGEFKVSEAKYVYETQWYMEQKSIIANLHFMN